MKPFSIEATKLLYGIPRIDCHLHSNYTDGTATLKDYLEAAIRREFTCVCFTEHVNKTTTWYDNLRDEVVLLRQNSPSGIEIYHGIEVRAVDYEGNLNTYPELVSQAEIVIGVVHSYPNEEKGVYRRDELNMDMALGLEYKTAMGLLENGQIDVLGHVGRTFEEHFGEFPPELYKDIVLKAKDKRIAVELNPRHQRNFRAFVSTCLDVNVSVSLGSDAHSISELGRAYEQLNEVLFKCH
jgi:putative hydrolase